MSGMPCPLRIRPSTIAGCCSWETFLTGFVDAWPRWFEGLVPTADQWREAERDWRAGNTGWEAAHNAQRVAKERAAKALEKPLVWLGGRNYAEADSALAVKYGKKQ
jgi:hypothetical protein